VRAASQGSAVLFLAESGWGTQGHALIRTSQAAAVCKVQSHHVLTFLAASSGHFQQ
jgi:hypothetical protein